MGTMGFEDNGSDYHKLQTYANTNNKVVADGIISTPNIVGFLSKMEKFFFSPPSDNLWSVHIEVDDIDTNNKPSLSKLYQNIIATNNTWSGKISKTSWSVKTPDIETNNKKRSDIFVSEFDDYHGVFLAQNVSFSPIQATVNSNVFPMGQQHGGFFNFGNIAQSRPNNRKLNINFLISNWDIGDILFDPWIAAVSQKGLIEDGNPSIKARITIKEYSSSLPKEYTSNKVIKQMTVRKQYVFRNCVPISRGEISKNYNPNDAGAFKNSIVNFIFDDYHIDYFY